MIFVRPRELKSENFLAFCKNFLFFPSFFLFFDPNPLGCVDSQIDLAWILFIYLLIHENALKGLQSLFQTFSTQNKKYRERRDSSPITRKQITTSNLVGDLDGSSSHPRPIWYYYVITCNLALEHQSKSRVGTMLLQLNTGFGLAFTKELAFSFANVISICQKERYFHATKSKPTTDMGTNILIHMIHSMSSNSRYGNEYTVSPIDMIIECIYLG